MAAFTLDKQRAGLCRQPAQDRPAAHFGFGDKICRAVCQHQERIQPGQMVGGKHHPAGHLRWDTGYAQPDAQCGEQCARPAHRQSLAKRATCPREYPGQYQQPHQDHHNGATQAQYTQH